VISINFSISETADQIKVNVINSLCSSGTCRFGLWLGAVSADKILPQIAQ